MRILNGLPVKGWKLVLYMWITFKCTGIPYKERMVTCSWFVFVFSLPVCCIMYWHCEENLIVNHLVDLKRVVTYHMVTEPGYARGFTVTYHSGIFSSSKTCTLRRGASLWRFVPTFLANTRWHKLQQLLPVNRHHMHIIPIRHQQPLLFLFLEIQIYKTRHRARWQYLYPQPQTLWL